QGEPEAAWRLAVLSGSGKAGIDDAVALQWLEKAAEAGHPAAQHALGDRYGKGIGAEQDFAKAREGVGESPNPGYAEAQEALGFMCQLGQGMEARPSEAAKWYQLAAEQNRAPAQNQLGILYAKGLIPDPDTAEQIDFYTNGGGQHVPTVAQELEKVAAVGRQNNDRRAVAWDRRAVEQHYDPAMVNLAQLIAAGRAGARARPADAVPP